MIDPINHPAHYKAGGIEAIDVIEAFAPANFHRGNAIKYLLRAGRKGDAVTDLRKAVWYIERELDRLKKSPTPTENDNAGSEHQQRRA
jgi:hypothetical protein